MCRLFLWLIYCSLAAADAHQGRIIGGKNAKQGQLPYQISLRYGSVVGPRNHICSGALVQVDETQVVVTAASCVLDLTNLYDLVAGNVNINGNGVGQARWVKNFIRHEDYDGRTRNDIALFFPDRPFTLNKNVQPIMLPAPNQKTSGGVIVSGWGIGVNVNKSEILQWVKVPSIDDDSCREACNSSVIEEEMICAGSPGKGSCDGDRGGLAVSVDGKYVYLAGIFSWGWGCTYYPGVYTEIAYFADWITANVNTAIMHSD